MARSTRQLIVLLFPALCAGAPCPGQDMRLLEPDTLPALVIYGGDAHLPFGGRPDAKLLGLLLTGMEGGLLHGEIVPAPLMDRVNRMNEAQLVSAIDSLFELDTVPYAMVNALILVAEQRAGRIRAAEPFVEWYGPDAVPGGHLYGEWITESPNPYGNALTDADSASLLRLVEPALDCGFHMPVPGVLTSPFGRRDGRPHNGIDLELRTGDPVRAMFPGVVRFAGSYGGYGRVVVVRHWNGLETIYAHLHRLRVAVGQEVDAGDVLGLGGNSGRSTGPHLHLEVRYKGVPIDPSCFIDLSSGRATCEVLVLKKTRWGCAAYPYGTRFHTVRKGEHLYGIAERYGIGIKDLCAWNGISRRTVLRVGQQVVVAPAGQGERASSSF